MMGKVAAVWYFVLALLLLSCPVVLADQNVTENGTTPGAKLASMPISFIPNQGQFEDNVSYQVKTSDQVISFNQSGIEFNQGNSSGPVFMLLNNSSPEKKIIGLDQAAGKANFYYGTDSSKWVTGVNLSTGIMYKDVYPGINLTLSGTAGHLKSEFTVNPGSEPSAITVQYQGLANMSLNANGDLILKTATKDIIDEAPVSYQVVNGQKVNVTSSYLIGADNTVTFNVGAYNKSIPLVIDPVLRYSLYFGGDGRDTGNSIAVDNKGYAYFVGTTWSDHLKYFKTLNQTYDSVNAQGFKQGSGPQSVQPYFGGGDKDAFVVKINPDGTDLEYITYIGGKGTDEGVGLTIDELGNTYIVGGTNSPDFPTKNAYRGTISGGYDAFVTKLDPTGQNIVFSTFIGGTSDDFGYGIAIDAKKNVYVTGQTHSWDYPVVNRYQLSPFGGLTDAFITKLNPDGNSIIYSNFIGGSAYDAGTALAVDQNGYACILGQTESKDFFITQNAFQKQLKGQFNLFITKFDPEGKYPAAYSTYLGGSVSEDAGGVLPLKDGSLVVTGVTKSKDYPTVNPVQGTLAGVQNGIISTINPDGTALTQSTYFGGTKVDRINGVASDAAGNIYVIGTTSSPDLPTVRAYQAKPGGASDAFVCKFDPKISQTVYVTYLGGADNDEGRAIAVTGEGDAYLVGYTESKNFPKVWPYQQNYGDGDRDAFVAVLSEHDTLPVTDFVGVPTEGDAPLTVQFTDKSLGIPTSWAWEFGDGQNSTEQNPVHTYTQPGTYTVSLTAKNIVSSNKKTKENYIIVHEPMKPPVADFKGEPQSGLVPLKVTFTDLTTNKPTNWSWVFGDGGSSAEQNPVYTYTKPGNYTVNLTASNKAGVSSKEKPQYINALPSVVKPIADFNANPTSGMVPLNVTFTDLSKNGPTSWQWSFGDGSSSIQQNPVYTYQQPGVYSVCLNVSNAAGSDSVTKPELIHANPNVVKPIADFSANPTSGMVPLTVTFTDLSKNGPTAWQWNFGDGNTSTQQNPVYTYSKPGNYSVCLNVSNVAGSDSITKPEFIHALPAVYKPIADFNANPTAGTVPLTVTFTDLSKNNPTSWQWSFGDGSSSIQQNPVYVYKQPGVYSVCLNVSNVAGSDSITKPELIHAEPPMPQPVADFDANPRSGNVPLNVQFTDKSAGNPTKWQWTFGDGQSSTEQHPKHLYTQKGVYDVTLTVWNAVGTSTVTKPQFINACEPVLVPKASFIGEPRVGDAPLTVKFRDLSSNAPTSWVWNFGDGQTSVEQNPTHIYTNPGIYTVTLSVSNTAGSDVRTEPNYIQVNSPVLPPIADFSGVPTSGKAPLNVSFTDLSKNGPVSWMWNFGDGQTSVERNPTHIYSQAGKYAVSLTVKNTAGTDTKTKPEYVTVDPAGNPPTAQFRGSPTAGNAPLQVSFTDLSTGSPAKWQWNLGDGQTSNEQHPIHTYAAPGEYTVSLTAENQFGNSMEVKEKYIKVLSEPVPLKAAFMGEPTCGDAPLTVKFTDLSTGGPESWMWNFGEASGTSTQKNPTYTYTKPGDYTVILTITRGSEKSTEIRYQYIHVNPGGTPPVPDFVASPTSGKAPLTVCFTDISKNNPTSWRWDFGDGQTSTEQNPTHVYLKEGKYSVCLEAANSFGSAKACKSELITVSPDTSEPAEYYGKITLNGVPAGCGTVVEARGTGIEPVADRNPISVTLEGNYGTPVTLLVKGKIKSGEPITFWVKAANASEFVQAECYDVYGASSWVSSYPFRGGDKKRLDLRVGSSEIPPMPVLPHEFFGEASYNGAPLQVGSILTVKGENVIEGQRGNPLPITSSGIYGFGTLQKLVAQGELKKGQELTFWITPCGSSETVQAEVRDVDACGPWTTTYPYSEGGLTRLEIRSKGSQGKDNGNTSPSVPSLPMTISGKATVNNQPVQVGSLVSVTGAGVRMGVEGNPVEVSESGSYGTSTKLTVQGDMVKGTALSFSIYDSQTGQEYQTMVKNPESGQLEPTYSYEPGATRELELQATTINPMNSGGNGSALPASIPLNENSSQISGNNS